MHPNALVRDILAAKPLTPPQTQAMLTQAMTLQSCSGREDLRSGLLKGRRIGLMCPNDGSVDALLFRRAASALGAQVSHIPAVLEAGSGLSNIDATAQLLGRLYDAVECQGMDATVVRRLGIAAAIPIYPGLACAGNPCHGLARELPGEAAIDEKRSWVVQALLLESIR